MGRKSLRGYCYALFALTILVMSWESNLASAALITPSIPEESIRIRILANSDSVEDQWIKKEIREAIVASINSWEQSYTSIEVARETVRARLPELERIVHEQLARYGFGYGAQVELGQVEFPAKVFGKETYPAGDYEALRITLGAGQGENWWCVLFPPLCFGGGTVKAKAAVPGETAVMAASAVVAGDASVEEQSAEEAKSSEEKSQEKSDKAAQKAEKKTGKKVEKQSDVESENEDGSNSASEQKEDEVEVRFFLADVGKKVGKFFKSLF